MREQLPCDDDVHHKPPPKQQIPLFCRVSTRPPTRRWTAEESRRSYHNSPAKFPLVPVEAPPTPPRVLPRPALTPLERMNFLVKYRPSTQIGETVFNLTSLICNINLHAVFFCLRSFRSTSTRRRR